MYYIVIFILLFYFISFILIILVVLKVRKMSENVFELINHSTMCQSI